MPPPPPPCPQCKKLFVRRSRPQNLLERFFARLYVYMFRCQLCLHRFPVLQFGQRYRPELADMREYERIKTNLPASFSGTQAKGEGTIIDLSLRGAWIKTTQRVPRGLTLHLTILPSDQEKPIEIETTIVRWNLGKEFGLEFLEINPEYQDRLRNLLEQCWIRSLSQESPKKSRKTEPLPGQTDSTQP